MPSKAVKVLTLAKVDEIKAKIKVLQKMQKALVVWADACDGNAPIEQCPIIENLYKNNV